MKKITIYCPTFNSIKYIKGYLQNLEKQICKNFKVIFVDSFSNDGSYELIKNFCENSKIESKVIREKCSVYGAWNIAVENINTEYCMNFNTDDRLLPTATLTYEYYINKFNDVDMIYGHHNFISDLETLQILPITYRWNNLINILSQESEKKLYLTINPCGPFPLIKTESLKKLGKFDEKYFSSADYDMWLRMFDSGMKLKKINETIGYFLYRPDSVSQKNIKISEQHDREIQKKYLK